MSSPWRSRAKTRAEERRWRAPLDVRAAFDTLIGEPLEDNAEDKLNVALGMAPEDG